ncbi:heparinase II/III family protein [Ferrigenium kumadai]|uniref:heparinase II/III family protein n=1 Tax=Ferrigenium kumadai TaxID=1682490 RepID=UPI001BB37E8C|nr:heparinase II/III family protein [Ferrigenium kumadai]
MSDAAAWNAPQLEKLHLYNLHYFDDLNASSAIERSDWHRALIDRWVAENPPVGGAGWEPYPLSLRVVNWIKWSLSKNALSHSAIHSLAIQVRYLTTRLERHLLGNHLFANAKALVFAGCYFEGDEAAEWLRCGMRILEGEISEQILADGGHFERSTMYHALALEDMLDLLNLSRMFPDVFHEWRELVDRLPAVVEQMKKWLAAMCHPDGEISFFNDAAIGIAPPPEELFLYSNRLGCTCETATVDGVTWLKESGYIRVQDGDTVAILDVAPVGPDYLPGHAHADTLSFELSVGKRRVIVNSGTSRYGLGPQREHQRSTAAHSTVAINGENSSEVWAGFRVARRAYPFDVTVEETDEGICVSGSHDGYRRLPGRPVHRRQWTIRDGFIEVSDRIEGDFSEAVARYFLHPDVQVERGVGKSSARLGDIGLAWKAEGALMQVVESEYFPEFGIVCPSSCIELKASNSQFGFHLDWGVRCPETGLRQ